MTILAAKVRSKFTNVFIMNVFAEELNPVDNVVTPDPVVTPVVETVVTPDPEPKGGVNFEDLVSKARKEERDKLYPDLEKNKERANKLALVVGERDKTISTLEKEKEKLVADNKRLTEELADGTNTNKTVSDLASTITILENELDTLQVKYETDTQNLVLDSYKKEMIANAGGEIIAELVTGSTEEEINQSVESAKERYSQITQNAIKGVRLPRANPSATQIQLKDKSIDEIANMSNEQWAEERAKLGIK